MIPKIYRENDEHHGEFMGFNDDLITGISNQTWDKQSLIGHTNY